MDDAAAKALIDVFARQLLALAGGEAIPRQWKNYLLKSLRPPPRKRGRKPDYMQAATVIKSLVLAGDSARAPRTKHHNPAAVKDVIAQAQGISRKTVERIDDTFSQDGFGSLGHQEQQAFVEAFGAVAVKHGDSLNWPTQQHIVARISDFYDALTPAEQQAFIDWSTKPRDSLSPGEQQRSIEVMRRLSRFLGLPPVIGGLPDRFESRCTSLN